MIIIIVKLFQASMIKCHQHYTLKATLKCSIKQQTSKQVTLLYCFPLEAITIDHRILRFICLQSSIHCRTVTFIFFFINSMCIILLIIIEGVDD